MAASVGAVVEGMHENKSATEVLEIEHKREHEENFKLDLTNLIKEDGSLGTLLLACHVMQDGKGDLSHLINFYLDGVKPAAMAQQFKIQVLVTCVESLEKEAIERLRKAGLDGNFRVVSFLKDRESQTPKILEEQFKNDNDFKTAMEDVTLAYSISSPQMRDLLKPLLVREIGSPPVKIYNIREHGATLAMKFDDIKEAYEDIHLNDIAHRNMGAGFNQLGFGGLAMTAPSAREDFKAKKLFELSHREPDLLRQMLGLNSDKAITEAECLVFLRNTQFISCHYQEAKYEFAVIMLGLAISQLKKEAKLKTTDIVVNPGNFDHTIFPRDLVLANKIQIIYFKKGEKSKKYGTPTAERPDIFIRVHEHWFLHVEDKDCCDAAGRNSLGSSGDDGFEKVLRLMMFPVVQVKPTKIPVITDLLKLMKGLPNTENIRKFFDCLHTLNARKFKDLDEKQRGELLKIKIQEFSECYKSQAITEWQNVLKVLHRDFNFTSIAPHVVNQTILDTLRSILMQYFQEDSRIGRLNTEIERLDALINRRGRAKFNKLLADIRECTTQELDLRSVNLTQEQWIQVFKVIAGNPRIQSLNFEHNTTALVLVPILSQFIADNKTIKEINMSGCCVCDSLLIELCKGLQRNETLCVMYLQNNIMGDLGFKHLTEYLCSERARLISLNISSDFITGKSKDNILRVLRINKSLRNLKLPFENFSTSIQQEMVLFFIQHNETIHSMLVPFMPSDPLYTQIQLKLKRNLDRLEKTHEAAGYISENMVERILRLRATTMSGEIRLEELHGTIQDATRSLDAQQQHLFNNYLKEVFQKYQVTDTELELVSKLTGISYTPSHNAGVASQFNQQQVLQGRASNAQARLETFYQLMASRNPNLAGTPGLPRNTRASAHPGPGPAMDTTHVRAGNAGLGADVGRGAGVGAGAGASMATAAKPTPKASAGSNVGTETKTGIGKR